MRLITFILLIAVVLSTPASAISLFRVHWQDHYLTGNNNAAFVRNARKAGCYVWHVKGERKEEKRNEYGNALSKYLDADDFPKSWVKDNPEEAKQRIIAAFKKVEEELSKDRKEFGQKIQGGRLPATDAGL